MALLAIHRNESPVPTVAQAFLPAAPRFVSAVFARARLPSASPPRLTFESALFSEFQKFMKIPWRIGPSHRPSLQRRVGFKGVYAHRHPRP